MFRFIDREEEMRFLNERHESRKAEMIVIYGRRRIGKSELIKKFIKEKPAIYFLATKTIAMGHLKKFAEKAASFFNDYPPAVNTWEECFGYLGRKAETQEKKLIIAIDEFPYMIQSNSELPSLFQLFWDEHLKEKNVMLILSGSSVAMMESEVLGSKSPLYGRRTGQIKVPPFKFKDALDFYPKLDAEKTMEFYAVAGNIPLYLLELDENKDVFENIRDKVLAKKELLNEEAEFLLKEELREPSTYQAILEAMAAFSRANEIAQKARIELHSMDRYLKTLLKLGLILKESPATEGKKTKKVCYFIKDNFLDFWYRFCFPNASLMEEAPEILMDKSIKPNFNAFVGEKFESVCMEALWELNRRKELPFAFTEAGRQWGRIEEEIPGQNTYEIDICAISRQTKEILFAECKWQEKVDANALISKLAEKSRHVQWHNNLRKECYTLFAKSFSKKISQYEGKQVFCFDLKDMARLFGRGR